MKNEILEIKSDKPIWVIGDVHGQYELLINLLDKLPKDEKVFFVGDLIDRGDKSKEVVELIKNNERFLSVLGNHEDTSIESLEYNVYAHWFQNGGFNTIQSYVDIPREIYEKGFYQNKDFFNLVHSSEVLKNHKEWMKELPLIIKIIMENEKPLYISHSGINFEKTDEELLKYNPKERLIWNRDKYPSVDYAINIHGHTIMPKVLSDVSKSQINIDSGGYMANDELFGFLTAIQYPSMKRIYSDRYKDIVQPN